MIGRRAASGASSPRTLSRAHGHACCPRGDELIADGQRRIDDLARSRADWDGSWVIVTTSIPHARRAVRERVYRYLTWSGFGTPMPGTWVSPHVGNEPGARFAIQNFGLTDSTLCFVGTWANLGLDQAQIVSRAWDLDGLDSHYATLVERHGARTVGTDEQALAAVLALDADLRDLPALDPHLPPALAPASVSRDSARQLLARRQAWLPSARRTWTQLTLR